MCLEHKVCRNWPVCSKILRAQCAASFLNNLCQFGCVIDCPRYEKLSVSRGLWGSAPRSSSKSGSKSEFRPI